MKHISASCTMGQSRSQDACQGSMQLRSCRTLINSTNGLLTVRVNKGKLGHCFYCSCRAQVNIVTTDMRVTRH